MGFQKDHAPYSAKTRFKKGHATWNKGLTKEIDKRVLRYAENLVPWNKGTGPKCTDCSKRISHRGRCRKCYGMSKKGSKNLWWKGGKGKTKCKHCAKIVLFYRSRNRIFCSRVCQGKAYSGENCPVWKKDRNSLVRRQKRNDSAYCAWRMAVWSRDFFKCRILNEDCDGPIEAHHILGWSYYPELRYEVNNGITLCHAHHPLKRAEEKRLAPVFRELVSVSKV